jgi:hypothetical protein
MHTTVEVIASEMLLLDTRSAPAAIGPRGTKRYHGEDGTALSLYKEAE